MYRLIDCMTWPCPCADMSAVEWRLRHSTPSQSDLMVAASVMAAYRQMVEDPTHKRQMIVRELRQGPNLPPNGKLQPRTEAHESGPE